MMMARLTVLLFAASSVSAKTTTDYSGLLEGVWKQSDTDKSGKLSLAEFKDACVKMDLNASTFNLHNGDIPTFYAAIDKDSDGALTKKELADAMTDFPSYKAPLQAAFTNGANSVPSTSSLIKTPSKAFAEAKARVVMSLQLEGKVGEIYAGTRRQIKSYFATSCGVPLSQVIVTFLPTKPAASGRRLQSAAATPSVTVEGTAFVKDNAAVAAAKAKLPKDAAGFAAVPAFGGLTVTSAKVTTRAVLSLSYTEPIIVGVVLLVLGVGLCVMATIVAKKKAAKDGKTGGCFTTGCCSFYAVKLWAFGEFLALIAIVATVFFLYTRMDSLTKTILGLVDTIIAFVTNPSSIVQGVAGGLPPSIVSQLSSSKALIPLLPFAVMGPGAVCMVLLLLASLCPLSKARKGSYCFSKCVIMLANLFLLLSLVFYILFVAVALFLENAPPSLKAQIARATAICDTLPPSLQQMLADAKGALDMLATAGQAAPASLTTTLTDMTAIVNIVDTGCGHINQLFVDVYNIFLPGLMCVVAILFAIFVNNTLCCAEGCCKSPPAGSSSSGAKKKEVEMSQEV